MKECAYCGIRAKLTKEHVFSGWVRKPWGAMKSQTDGEPGIVTPGLLKVEDVCGPCNNGPLSQLDGYAKSLFNSYFHDLSPSETRPFQANFHKLARYLMKTSYNDARMAVRAGRQAGGGRSAEHAERVLRHQLFADYIRGQDNEPPRLINVFGGTLPGPVEKIIGVGEVSLKGDENEAFLIQWIQIGAYCFIVHVWNTNIEELQRSEILESICAEQNWVVFEPTNVDVNLNHITGSSNKEELRFIDPAGSDYQQ